MPPALFLVFWIALAILGHVWFHVNFRIIDLNPVKNIMGNLTGIALNLQITLNSIVIVKILLLSIQKHGISSISLIPLQFYF